jgi:hypothetical protein
MTLRENFHQGYQQKCSVAAVNETNNEKSNETKNKKKRKRKIR